MEKLISQFDHIYIDHCSRDSELAEHFYSLFPQEKIKYCFGSPLKEKGVLSAEEFDRSKKNIFITEFKGSFFKRCPGARPGLTCCNYFVLNLGLQCDMNCSYCYLQSFINSPIMTIYSNIDQALNELEALGKTLKTETIRVGTGEVIDSLSLDSLTHYSKKLVKFFNQYPKWSLEFKTKSAQVHNLLDIKHNGQTIVSWSINPQFIIKNEEFGTASLHERLEAARLCRDYGYKISFHIDPIIWHSEWKKNYHNLVEQIAETFTPNDIPYISLGALRFQPEQRHMMRERFGMQSLVTQAELFPSHDGKLRYDHNLRAEMFDSIIKKFKSINSNWNIFLCMEQPETWLKSYGHMPKSETNLHELFDHNPIRKFNNHQKQARSEDLKL